MLDRGDVGGATLPTAEAAAVGAAVEIEEAAAGATEAAAVDETEAEAVGSDAAKFAKLACARRCNRRCLEVECTSEEEDDEAAAISTLALGAAAGGWTDAGPASAGVRCIVLCS